VVSVSFFGGYVVTDRENVAELQEAWRAAIAEERNAHERYLAAKLLTADPATRALFDYLAAEELKHQRLLEDEFTKAFEKEM